MKISWDLPSSFRFAVQDTSDPQVVKVYRGQLRDGRSVEVQPFTLDNMDKVAAMMRQLRLQEDPVVTYITNHFVDIHRSGGRAHVVERIRQEDQTYGQDFRLGPAAAQAQADRMGNCDRVNAWGYRDLANMLDRQHPVLYHWTTGEDHNTVLVGDPRMPKYGERNTVVADSHAVFPMPHTLDEAAYGMKIPRDGDDDYEDLEKSWLKRVAGMDDTPLPAAVSEKQQQAWLRNNGWPAKLGAKVVKRWLAEHIKENGAAPDRWKDLFSCKDPSTRYVAPGGQARSYNQLPLEFVRRRTQAFLQMHGAYPETSSSGSSSDDDDDDDDREDGASGGGRWHGRAHIVDDLALEAVTPFRTRVRDARTGKTLMAMDAPRHQGPASTINHSFPIKHAAAPDQVHPLYAWDVDKTYCDPRVTIDDIELPEQTRAIMRAHFPRESQEPGYFAERMAEIRAEYEWPIYRRPPPSSSRWQAVRLTDEHRHVAPALKGQYGVVPVEYDKQNVGGMGPAFAGAIIGNSQENRAYLSRISRQFGGDRAAARKLFQDYAIQVGQGRHSRHVAPWGGGNVTQFLNGKVRQEEREHFITVDVIVHIRDKNGKPQRELMPHLFQVREVPPGEQALLQYGEGYFEDRPGIEAETDAGMVKTEPVEDGLEADDASEHDAASSSSLTSLGSDDAASSSSLSSPSSDDDDGAPVSHAGKRRRTADADTGASVARPLKRRRAQEQGEEQKKAPWPDDVPYRMLDNGLYVEHQAAMSVRHGTSNTCASHAVNQLFQGSAMRHVVHGAHLGEVRDYIADNLDVEMEEMIALLISAGGQAAQEQFEAQLVDMAIRIESSGAAIVDLGEQRDDTESVFNHYVTLVRLASDARVYLLDSLDPQQPRSFDNAYDALEELARDHAQTLGTSLSILVPPEGTVMPPVQGHARGNYVLDQGFVPQQGWRQAQAQAASSTLSRKAVQTGSVEDYRRMEPGVTWDATTKRWIVRVIHPVTKQTQAAAVNPKRHGGNIHNAWEEACRIVRLLRKGKYVPPPKKRAAYQSDVEGVTWDEANHRWRALVRRKGDTKPQTEFFPVKHDCDDLEKAITEARKKAEQIADQMRKGVYVSGPRNNAADHQSKVIGVRWRSDKKQWLVEVKRKEGANLQTARVNPKDFSGDIDAAMKEAEDIAEQMRNGTYVPQLTRKTAYTSKVPGVHWDVGKPDAKKDVRRWRIQVKRRDDPNTQRADVYVRDHGGDIDAAMREAERIAGEMRNGTYVSPPKKKA